MVERETEHRVAGLRARRSRRPCSSARPRAAGRSRARRRRAPSRARRARSLDLVDDLAAAVVALARVALGVLVRRHRADRLEHGRPGEVLRRDQLDLAALPLELAPEQLGDLRVDLGEPRASAAARRSPARPPSRSLSGDEVHRSGLQALAAQRATARASDRATPRPPATAPSRSDDAARAPVRSITVDGVPGSRPASSSAAAAGADRSGHLVEARGRGLARARSRSSPRPRRRVEHALRAPRQLRDADADRRRARAVQPREAPRRVRQDERVRPGQQRPRDASARAAQLRHAARTACRRSPRAARSAALVPALQRVQPARRRLAPASAQRP